MTSMNLTQGKLPKCRGCGQKIDRTVPRIRYKFFEHEKFFHPTIHIFCADANCVFEGVGNEGLNILMKMNWGNEKIMKDVVKELQMF